MWPTRAPRHELEHRVEHAEPGAQHRHDDDVGADPSARRPDRAASRRVTVAGRHLAQRFGGEQHADPRRRATEMLRRRALVAQIDERVVHERMIDEVDRHGSTLYNFCLDACTIAVDVAVDRSLALRSLAACRGAVAATAASGSRARRSSLVVTGGTVVTQNATRQVLSPGAVAIDGTDIVDVDTPRRDRRALHAPPRRSTRATRSSCPG